MNSPRALQLVTLRRTVRIALVAAATLGAGAPTPSDRATTSHRFDDVERWQKIFDDPQRDAWQKPDALIAALAIPPGAAVADLGAGTGYFTRHLAAAVGNQGSVLAIEVEPGLVDHLRARAEREGTANVTPILASAETPRLPRASVDLIVILDTYHHLDQRRTYLPNLRRALRPGGRIAIIDWKPGDLPEGPPADHKLAPEQVRAEMEAAGYRLRAQPELLPYQYVLIFEPAAEAP